MGHYPTTTKKENSLFFFFFPPSVMGSSSSLHFLPVIFSLVTEADWQRLSHQRRRRRREGGGGREGVEEGSRGKKKVIKSLHNTDPWKWM